MRWWEGPGIERIRCKWRLPSFFRDGSGYTNYKRGHHPDRKQKISGWLTDEEVKKQRLLSRKTNWRSECNKSKGGSETKQNWTGKQIARIGTILRHESKTNTEWPWFVRRLHKNKKHNQVKLTKRSGQWRDQTQAQTPYRAAKRSRMTGGNDAICAAHPASSCCLNPWRRVVNMLLSSGEGWFQRMMELQNHSKLYKSAVG